MDGSLDDCSDSDYDHRDVNCCFRACADAAYATDCLSNDADLSFCVCHPCLESLFPKVQGFRSRSVTPLRLWAITGILKSREPLLLWNDLPVLFRGNAIGIAK